ncbi:hypothetical protein ABIF72_004231 [Bradyrhizobium japonicum]
MTPETGKLVRKFRSGEKEAGFLSGDYLRVSINHKIYLVHRLVWKMVTGEEPVGYIDHIDGNRFNNAWANLRDVTHDQNMWNAKLFHNNTSGYRGVSFIQSHGMWRAAISVNGKKKHRAGPGCLDSAPLDLSGFLPGYAERGALRFCRCVGRA